MDFYTFVKVTYPIRGLVRLVTRMILARKNKRVILVFGLSRSGTTMLGQFLALGSSSVYIHEPEEEVLLQKYRLERSETFDHAGFSKFTLEPGMQAFKIHCLVCTVLQEAYYAEPTIETICIKPIYLTEIMEKVSRALNTAKILYISRHPCGRTESILRQRQLDEKVDIASLPESYIELLGHSWSKEIHWAQMAFRRHPEWYWVLFETLTKNPLAEFKRLYECLELLWDERVESRLVELTTGEDGGFYEIKRNSVAQAEKWRSALTEAQVEAIRRGCTNYKTNLYESF